jgi:cytosol alanyl aminopeptidase
MRALLPWLLVGCAGGASRAPAPAPPSPEPLPIPPPIVAPTPRPTLRLPGTVRPLAYRIELGIDPNLETFTGQVEIDVELREPAVSIWLNANDLVVSKAEVVAGGRTMTARATPAPPDFLALLLDAPAPSGKAVLRLAYQGRISSQESDGIFRQKERDDWYVFTQFEEISARRAFPSFDEPSYKVPFQITLRVRPDHVAVSNAPVASMTEAEGEKVVAFAPTRPLPTYLVAFAVGPFDLVDGGRAGKADTPLRVIGTRGRSREARYAVAVTPRIVAFLEDYFGLPYPYEKLDQIGVPRFGGAMENAGLVTYGQTILLIPPDEESIARRRRFAVTAVHEVAHHWFGDLVTLAWWDDIWLNEAFASWIEDKAVMSLEPTWDAAVSIVQTRSSAIYADALATARQIRQPIVTKDDISEAFDGITYDKGSAVLTMFEHWIGPEKFQKGIRRYLAAHAHGTATTRDFLDAISAEAGVDVAPPFSTFLDQPGAPLLTVRLACDAGSPRLVLEQQRYLPVGSKGGTAQTWRLPMCARWGAGAAEGRDCALITEARGELPLSAPSCPDWVLPNAGMLGYYRTRLKDDLLERLLKRWKTLTVPEQVGVVGDVTALASSAHLPLARALDLVPNLTREKSRHLQGAAAGIVSLLSDEVTPPELRPNRARFIKKMFGARARALGWQPKKGETDEDRLLRPTLMRLVAGRAEDPRWVAEARKLADRWLVDEKAIDPDLAGLVLEVAATHGDRAFFDRLHEAARKEKHDRKRRGRLLAAMASFRDPAIVKVALELTLGDELEARESITLLWGALDPEETREQAWEFLKQNLDRLLPRLPRDYAANFIGAGTAFCDEAHRADVEAFFRPRAAGWLSGPRELAQTLEDLDLCIARKAAHADSVVEFLARYGKKPRSTTP